VTKDTGKEVANTDHPQKKGLDISIFLKHVTQVDTSIGRVFLFPLRWSDIGEYENLPPQPSMERIRAYLPRIASLSQDYSLKQCRVAIPLEEVGKLPDSEIESLADAYGLSSALREAREGAKGRAPVVRELEESPTAYLGRLLESEAEKRAMLSRKIVEAYSSSTQGIFDQVRKSSLELGDSWRQLERLTKASAVASTLETETLGLNNHIVNHTAMIARERAEGREMLRLTAETSTKSAKTLQELADAASKMLEMLDNRDVDAKRTTKTQLWIAVGTVVLSALLAGASVIQDCFSNASGDKWQESVLDELKAINKHDESVQAESQLFRDQVQRLAEAVVVLDGDANAQVQQANQASTEAKKALTR
tara:strand:- start:15930 stop:17024 length:1095 start_codon:yes stop_codon:yes gene_type:complete